MSDNLKNRGPQDRERVNMNESSEVAYRPKHFGVTNAAQRAAVNTVGVMVKDVKRHLGK